MKWRYLMAVVVAVALACGSVVLLHGGKRHHAPSRVTPAQVNFLFREIITPPLPR